MGCLTANGRERLLESSTSNSVNGATAYPMASLGGAYVGVVVDNYDDHYYGDASKTVDVFDLRTGARSGFGGESSACHHFAPMLCGIDQLVVGQNGVSAVHVLSGRARRRDRGVVCVGRVLRRVQRVRRCQRLDRPARWPVVVGKRGGATQLQRMSCPSTALCVGVDGSASVYVSANPIGGSSTWTKTQIPGVQNIYDVSCPSTTLCVASASGGNLLVSTDPTGGPSAWSVDAVDGTDNLSAVSCPTTSECFAVAGGGDVISSSNPTGGAGAWTVRHLGLAHALRANLVPVLVAVRGRPDRAQPACSSPPILQPARGRPPTARSRLGTCHARRRRSVSRSVGRASASPPIRAQVRGRPTG